MYNFCYRKQNKTQFSKHYAYRDLKKIYIILDFLHCAFVDLGNEKVVSSIYT